MKQNYHSKVTTKLYSLLRINNHPVVRVYNGFGNGEKCLLYGHVLNISPYPRKKFRNNIIVNVLSLIRLFFVSPMPGVKVTLEWEGETFEATTEKDGLFKFEWPTGNIASGEYVVNVVMWEGRNKVASGSGKVFVPLKNRFTFISDIDDTFLVSHSSTLLKRLYVILTENAYTRKPFDGVVAHYQMLEKAGAKQGEHNPFFYVSSSEWNLYEYITHFLIKNKLPQGVLLLNQIKTIDKILQTGKNNHGSKFVRIVRIIEAFPDQQFVLLGDDTQRDPYIYESITSHFPDKVFAVYIRKVGKKHKPEVMAQLEKIAARNIIIHYFGSSAMALDHWNKYGPVQES